MWNNFGLFCSFSPNLPRRIHFGLHCDASEKKKITVKMAMIANACSIGQNRRLEIGHAGWTKIACLISFFLTCVAKMPSTVSRNSQLLSRRISEYWWIFARASQSEYKFTDLKAKDYMTTQSPLSVCMHVCSRLHLHRVEWVSLVELDSKTKKWNTAKKISGTFVLFFYGSYPPFPLSSIN